MAITLRWFGGAESYGDYGGLADPAFAPGSTITSGSQITAHTGTGCWRSDSGFGQVNIAATYRFRVGLWMLTSTNGSAKAVVLEWRQADGTHIGWVGNSATPGTLGAYVGNHAASVSATGTSALTLNAWQHIGIDVFVDATNGWIRVYQDGTKIIDFSGNTGSAQVAQIILSNCGSGVTWAWQTAFDDMAIEDTTGEGTGAVAPPDRRVYPIYPNAAGGTYAEGHTKGGGASAYTAVDEGRQANDDTDYNYVEALNERDTYNCSTFVPPVGGTIVAAKYFARAQKSNASVDSQIALMARGGAVATDWEDSAQAVTASWKSYYSALQLLDPSGNAWAIAQVDSLQIGFRGKGTF